MTTINKESKEVTLYVRMCATLAFLRPEDVEGGCGSTYIHGQNPGDEFFNYFVKQWL